jgi:hypothetical protein
MVHMSPLSLSRLRLQELARQLSKRMLMMAIRLIRIYPGFKHFLNILASRLGLTNQLKSMYWAVKIPANGFHNGWADAPQTIKQLSPSARYIYSDLQNAIVSRRKEQS